MFSALRSSFHLVWPWAVKHEYVGWTQTVGRPLQQLGWTWCLLRILDLISLFVQFKPLEQLMGVFPAASGNFLPDTWRNLMSSPVSVEARIMFACACMYVSMSTSAAGFIHHWLLPWGFCYWSQWKEVRVAGWVHASVQISRSAWIPSCSRGQSVSSVWLALITRLILKVLPFCRLWMNVGWERH